MSIQLSKDEIILKDYAYTSIKAGSAVNKVHISKNLIVTNKRVIHREVSNQIGAESVSNEQLFLKNIKSVDTSYGKKSHPLFLVLAILFTLLSSLGLASLGAASFIALIPAAIFVIMYIVKKEYVLNCDFGYNSCNYLSVNTMSMGAMSSKASRKRKNAKIKIIVNKDVAQDIAEEIGAVILDAIANLNNGEDQ